MRALAVITIGGVAAILAAPALAAEPSFKLSADEWQAMCPVIASWEELEARGVAMKATEQDEPDWPPNLNVIEGSAELTVRIDANGVPVDVQVIKARAQGFADESARAIRKWRYEPVVLDGKPVCVEAVVSVSFRHR